MKKWKIAGILLILIAFAIFSVYSYIEQRQIIVEETLEEFGEMVTGAGDENPKFSIQYGGTDVANITHTGNLEVVGNVTIPKDQKICLVTNCSKYIYYNGSNVVIQG